MNTYHISELKPEFNFAGFTWPKYVPMLPKGKLTERLAKRRHISCGAYYGSSKPVTRERQGTSFYLESDFAPGLRWRWCNELCSSIQHTGWFTDEYGGGDKIRGIVLVLPHGRGFLAGWSMGEGMTSYCEYGIYDNDTDAAWAADTLAESAAEKEREYQAGHDEDDEEET